MFPNWATFLITYSCFTELSLYIFKRVGLVQSQHHYNLIECNLLSPWYSWTSPHLSLNSNQSLIQINVVVFSFSNPLTMHYSEGDVAMLTCWDEYNETIQISSVLYNYSTCSHGDTYGIQNLCDGQRACSFNVANSNVGSACRYDGKASLQVLYNCKRKLYFIQTLLQFILQLCDFEY
jgi:hypothetical protein